MTEKPKLNEGMAKAVEAMLDDPRRFLEGLVRALQYSYPTLADEAPAAVGHAVEKLITRATSADDPEKYLAACDARFWRDLASADRWFSLTSRRR